ncbi:MAG TPA: heme lyase CcmF/NrfE family subunit [Stellaceae bacterium]|nr:heme lyase CcmF/NrfE family subunit [Stellaceae bacterium]
MIVEIGHYALILALCLAVLQSTVPLFGAARRNMAWMTLAQSTAVTQFVLIAVAFGALINAYVTSDFSVANVYENSSTLKPLLYKVTGVWGNHEGSMILWVFILSLFGAAVALFGVNLPPALRARVLAVQGMIGTGFLLFILLTSDPFRRLVPAPLQGEGLNPVLQDPGLAFHPPFLYLGYVGFSIAFSFAVAALIEGRVDAAWARWVRPWTLAAWCTLTVGIAMGSWWSYYTLGWGGWWFWDPVENASFMPWLVGTALLHSAIVVEKRDALKSWTILLAIITFSLSLVGTFLVRSGVLTSVHAFALSPGRGDFILALLLVAIGGSLGLYAWRAPQLKGGGIFAPISREGALVLNNLLLCTGCATVFLGTLYPLFSEDLGGPKLSVGFPFFNRTFVPLMVPMLMAVAVGPMLAWKRGDLRGALQRLWLAAAGTLLALLVAFYVTHGGPVLAVLGLGLAAWVFLGVVIEWTDRIRLGRTPLAETWRRARTMPRAAHGMTLAHLGLAITVAGITASAWQQERIDVVHPGGDLTVAGYVFHLDDVKTIPSPDFTAERADITVRKGNDIIAVMHPEKRSFAQQGATTSVTAIHTNLLADLYAALGDSDGKGGWTLRLYWKPLVPWIWIGAVFMAAGGIISLSDRRWRVGIAARARAPRGAQPAE